MINVFYEDQKHWNWERFSGWKLNIRRAIENQIEKLEKELRNEKQDK